MLTCDLRRRSAKLSLPTAMPVGHLSGFARMGVSMSSTDFEQRHRFFLCFLSFRSALSGAHPLVPTRWALMAAAHRGGQGWPLAMSFTTYILSRPFLHGPEHGCTLGASRSTSRGVRPAASKRQDDLRPAAQGWRPRSRATSLYSVNLRAGDRNLDAVMRIGGEASSDASSFS